MQIESLAPALEREHQEIDAGITEFTTAPGNLEPLSRAIGALRRHIYLEEEFLFPLLHQAEPGLVAPILVILREHAQIWSTLDDLEAAPGTDAGLGLCRQLAARLSHHNLKEERVLYPQADHALTPEAAHRLRAFLESGSMPAGWVCIRARP